MVYWRRLSGALCCVIGLNGCTTSLSTQSALTSADSTKAVRGMPYSLPMLQYDVQLTRTLAQCVETVGKGKKATKTALVKFVISTEATPNYLQGETFDLDYTALPGPSKISSLSLETYDNGTFKSLNASAEDRTANMVQASVKAAVGLASLAGGLPLPSAAPSIKADEQMLVCTPEAIGLLQAVDNATANLKGENELLAAISKTVAGLTEHAAAGTLNTAGKKKLEKALADQTKQAKAVMTAQAKLQKTMNAVSVTTMTKWPQSPTARQGYQDLEGADLQKFMHLVTRAPLASSGDNRTDNRCDADTTVKDCLSDKLQIAYLLETTVTVGGRTANKEETVDTTTPQKGIFIRPPVVGHFLICRGTDQSCGNGGGEALLRAPDTLVPQLGQLRFLPFENPAFENNSLALSLRPNGLVEKFEYRTLKARGEAIATTASDAVSQLWAYQVAKDKTEADAETTKTAAAEALVKSTRDDEIATLQFEIDRITNAQQLAKLSEPTAVTDLPTIQAQMQESSARRLLYEALLAERQAKASLDVQ